MKSLEGLHIVREQRQKTLQRTSLPDEPSDLTSEWLDHPERWDRQTFISSASIYLSHKNGSVDIADKHLISMLASQIEIYVESILKLRTDGLVMSYNGGVTVGPNPYMTIADKALYRIVQLMKELELSPKAREGYRSVTPCSSDLQSLLSGP